MVRRSDCSEDSSLSPTSFPAPDWTRCALHDPRHQRVRGPAQQDRAAVDIGKGTTTDG